MNTAKEDTSSSPLLSLAVTATEGPKAANFSFGATDSKDVPLTEAVAPPPIVKAEVAKSCKKQDSATGEERDPSKDSVMTNCVESERKGVSGHDGVTTNPAGGVTGTSTLITPVASSKRSRDDTIMRSYPATDSTTKTPNKEGEDNLMNSSADSSKGPHSVNKPEGQQIQGDQSNPAAPFVPQGPFDPRVVSPYHQYHMGAPPSGGWNESMGQQAPYSPYWPPHYNPYMKGYNGQFSPPAPHGMSYPQYPMISQPQHPPFNSPQVDPEKKTGDISNEKQEEHDKESKNDEVKKNIFGDEDTKKKDSPEFNLEKEDSPNRPAVIKRRINDDDTNSVATNSSRQKRLSLSSSNTKKGSEEEEEMKSSQAKKLKVEQNQPSGDKTDPSSQANENSAYMNPPPGYSGHPYPPYYTSVGRGYGGYPPPPYGYYNHFQDQNSMMHEYPMQPPPLWYPPPSGSYPGTPGKGQEWQGNGGHMYPPGMYPGGPVESSGAPEGETKNHTNSEGGHSESKPGGSKNELASAVQKSTPEVESVHRCVQMIQPFPTKMWTDKDAKDVAIPEFQQLVNFPTYLQKNRSPLLSHGGQNNGMRRCVMCGLERPFTVNASSGSNVSPSQRGMLRKGLAPPQSKSEVDYTMHIIPRQNKGLCTSCDVAVWVIADSKTEIKWCKGCKNFKAWIAFGEKGLATKCVKCRERQREKYAAKKEQMKKNTKPSSQKENEDNQKKRPTRSSRGKGKKNEGYNSSSPSSSSTNGLSCLIAATDQVANSNTEEV